MPTQAQTEEPEGETLTKEEKKFWKDRAKKYVKSPELLMAEFENMQNQINDLKRRNKDLETQAGYSSSASRTIDSLKNILGSRQAELNVLKQNYSKMQEAYRTQKTVADRGIKRGLVYRVQIGAFVLEGEHDYSTLDNETFSIERSDGFYKYILGVFRSKEEAENFRSKLLEMGMKQPWIVPYIDGVRVSSEEADAFNSNQATDSYYMDGSK